MQLIDQSKLVYSPHVYGPSVYLQHYFTAPGFPNNMPAVWEQHFAFAQGQFTLADYLISKGADDGAENAAGEFCYDSTSRWEPATPRAP